MSENISVLCEFTIWNIYNDGFLVGMLFVMASFSYVFLVFFHYSYML